MEFQYMVIKNGTEELKKLPLRNQNPCWLPETFEQGEKSPSSSSSDESEKAPILHRLKNILTKPKVRDDISSDSADDDEVFSSSEENLSILLSKKEHQILKEFQPNLIFLPSGRVVYRV